MARQILTTDEEKAPFFKGMNKLADAVTMTMGVSGRQTIISAGWGQPIKSTKDGYNTAKSIALEDWIEDAGANLIKGVATKTVDDAGDNTTTSILLAQTFINDGIKRIKEKNLNPRKVKQGIEAGVRLVVETLKGMSQPIGDDNDKIKNVATISANNDAYIGKIIADAYKKIGNKGLLLIEESGTVMTTIEVVEGAQVPRGFYDDRFINDKDKNRVVFEKPIFIVVDADIKRVKEIEPILIAISQKYGHLSGTPIVIYAHDFDGEVHSSVIMNNIQKNSNILLMKAPSAYRKEALQDVAILTGATMICDEIGLKTEDLKLEHLGMAEKFIANKANSIIIKGNFDKEKFEEHKKAIQVYIEQANAQEKEIFEKRLAEISGSVGVIKVGGATDVEMKEAKDRVDDAVRATKCAIEMGVLAGGGVSLIRCIKELDKLKPKDDEKEGIEIVKNVLMSPLKKMLENASEDMDIFSKVIEMEGNNGYNFKTQQFEDLLEGGVMDATKVTISALVNASSVACQILTAGAFVIETRQTN